MSARRGGATGQGTYRRAEERVSIDLYKFFACLQTVEDEPNVLVKKERLINLLNEQQPPRAKAVSEEQQRAYKELADKIKDLEKQLATKADVCNTPSTSNALPTTSNAPTKRARASSSSSTTSSDSDVAIVEEKKKEGDAAKGAEVAKKKKKE